MSKMAHFYPNIKWQELSLRQLNGYLIRIDELYNKPQNMNDVMKEREMRIYRTENNL